MMEREKFPFTIENILSKYPNSNEDRLSFGISGAGLEDKAASPVGRKIDTTHHACLCCCYCSHCGDIFHTDFIHEGKIRSSARCRQYHLFCSPTSDLISSSQPVSTGGPRRCSQIRAGWEKLRGRRRHPVRHRGGPGVTALFSQRSSWMHLRSCFCRISIQT